MLLTSLQKNITKNYFKNLIFLNIQLKDAIHEIEHLNPKPGGSYAGNNRIVEHIVPDFAIKIVDGELELTLNGRNAPELHVSREYHNMLKGYKDSKGQIKLTKRCRYFYQTKIGCRQMVYRSH